MDKTGRALAVGFQSLLITDSAMITRSFSDHRNTRRTNRWTGAAGASFLNLIHPAMLD
jgi:hypothetical protein